MTSRRYDLYAIGNALVDAEYDVTDALLQAAGVAKRHMTLIDAAGRAALLDRLRGLTPRRTGGGSAGNTVVAMAQLGSRTFYSCRVADDELGHYYAQDLRSNGVRSNLERGLSPDGQTGTCVVLVTPDAERSMSTFLGASAALDASALDNDALQASRIYYMEGYLASSPSALDAALQGRRLARRAGARLAATLSDVSMIRFCRSGLNAMVGDADSGALDYLFCNEEEAQVWCGSTDVGDLCHGMARLARVVCLTRSAKGCLVLEDGRVSEVPAVPVRALDTNGAGDMFAGAFLHAVIQGYASADAAALANQAAAKVVAQYGNRLAPAVLTTLWQDFTQRTASNA
ncbi:MAG: adenosine kinase [Rhodoferax sp.]